MLHRVRTEVETWRDVMCAHQVRSLISAGDML